MSPKQEGFTPQEEAWFKGKKPADKIQFEAPEVAEEDVEIKLGRSKSVPRPFTEEEEREWLGGDKGEAEKAA